MDSAIGKVAVKMTRTQQWAEAKLEASIPEGSVGFIAIANRVAEYEVRRMHIAALSIFSGICADNDKLPEDGDTHAQFDLTFDASGNDFVSQVTQFTEGNLKQARKTAAVEPDNFKVLAVHSAVFTRMKKNNLIDYWLNPANGTPVAEFDGLRVIYDDGLPKVGNVYDSYLFYPNAFDIGWGNPSDATVVEQEVLHRKWVNSIHLPQHIYQGPSRPTNADLAHADSWSRRCPRSQVGIARLRTREA